MKPFLVTLIAAAVLAVALPGKAAAQSTLDQKLDKIIDVLVKTKEATNARFESVDQKFAALGARLEQLEQKSNSYPPPVPFYGSPTYTPPPAQSAAVYYPPAYEFQPLPNSPLSGTQQKTLNDYFDRVCNQTGDIRMSPGEQQGMIQLMKLLGK